MSYQWWITSAWAFPVELLFIIIGIGILVAVCWHTGKALGGKLWNFRRRRLVSVRYAGTKR